MNNATKESTLCNSLLYFTSSIPCRPVSIDVSSLLSEHTFSENSILIRGNAYLMLVGLSMGLQSQGSCAHVCTNSSTFIRAPTVLRMSEARYSTVHSLNKLGDPRYILCSDTFLQRGFRLNWDRL